MSLARQKCRRDLACGRTTYFCLAFLSTFLAMKKVEEYMSSYLVQISRFTI